MADDDPFAGIEQLMRAHARSVPRIELRAATPDQVDLVASLKEVARVIVEHCQLVMTGEETRWVELADVLVAAERACRAVTAPS